MAREHKIIEDLFISDNPQSNGGKLHRRLFSCRLSLQLDSILPHQHHKQSILLFQFAVLYSTRAHELERNCARALL